MAVAERKEEAAMQSKKSTLPSTETSERPSSKSHMSVDDVCASALPSTLINLLSSRLGQSTIDHQQDKDSERHENNTSNCSVATLTQVLMEEDSVRNVKRAASDAGMEYEPKVEYDSKVEIAAILSGRRRFARILKCP